MYLIKCERIKEKDAGFVRIIRDKLISTLVRTLAQVPTEMGKSHRRTHTDTRTRSVDVGL